MGIRGDDADIARRYEKFGSNKYETPPVKSFFHFLKDAPKQVINVIHLTCAAASLGFGIKTRGLKEGWYEGGSIFAGVIVFISISAASNFYRSRHFNLLSPKVVLNNVQVDVVRNGRKQRMSMFEILVGDVICLKHGDQVPADGLYLDGHCLQVDELSLTGHSDRYVAVNSSNNPFLVSGTKVCMVEGDAWMLVTSVGNNTVLGEILNHMNLVTGEQMNPRTRLDNLVSSMFLLYCLICTFKNIFSVFQENLVCILFLLDGPGSLSKLNRTHRLTFPNIYRSIIQPFLSKKAVAKKHCTSSTVNDNVNLGNNFFKIDQKVSLSFSRRKISIDFKSLEELLEWLMPCIRM
ncbi:hypothetical protein Pint_24728 [Pistacia integerrima]|uniref:Uncharacterized protein n=1 Tax=Pistacia integerrima TaxID=434235 RepID=A0ACC0YCD2_9ROSI|nr:hypothetical protein Pint_24728 [Pistacia integerrima]